jgi:hypothetical protein
MAIPNVTTTAISNVPVQIEDVVAEPNVDEAIDEDCNRMDINKIQPSVFHIKPLLDKDDTSM